MVELVYAAYRVVRSSLHCREVCRVVLFMKFIVFQGKVKCWLRNLENRRLAFVLVFHIASM